MRAAILGTKVRTLRILTALIVVGVVVLGISCKLGLGTVCSLGPDRLAYLCPLGFLQTALASRSISPRAWLSLAIVLGTIVLFGRYFCSWICPTVLVKTLRRQEPPRPHHEERQAGGRAEAIEKAGEARRPRWLGVLDTRHLVLAGALVSSALFGFPVFCLICPVGLFFGTVFAISRLFTIQQASLELLLFPAVLALEILVLKNWCRSFCPLGALLSLLSGLNPFFKPTISADRCLRSSGTNCQVCNSVCPEGISLHQPDSGRSRQNCTRCLTCADRCPVRAIGIHPLPQPRPLKGGGEAPASPVEEGGYEMGERHMSRH